MSASRVENIGQAAEGWVRERIVQTAVLLGARRGRIVLHRAYGTLTGDPAGPPAPLDAVFNTASVGKVITATAVMILVEEGQVGLNRPVSSYVPEFRGQGKDAVLVRHLLTHTSGLRDADVDRYAEGDGRRDPVPPAPVGLHPVANEHLARRSGAPLWKPPGQEMSYCIFGFDVLGELVRRVSGEPLDRFASDRIFGPLGMADTSYCEVDIPRERRAPLPHYILAESDSFRQARLHDRLWWGSGSTVSTALDMAVFCQLFLNGGAYGDVRILHPRTVSAMMRNQIPGVGSEFLGQVFPEASWGFGWSVHGNKIGACGTLHSPEACEHWGAGGIYVWVDPRYDLLGVYFTSFGKLYDTLAENLAHRFRNDAFSDALTAAIEVI